MLAGAGQSQTGKDSSTEVYKVNRQDKTSVSSLKSIYNMLEMWMKMKKNGKMSQGGVLGTDLRLFSCKFKYSLVLNFKFRSPQPFAVAGLPTSDLLFTIFHPR